MSVKAPWFRCFPGNFLLGTAGMPPMLHKSFTRLLMGLYEAGGTLAYDRHALRHLLEVRTQDVDRLMDDLKARGKITVVDGVIHNSRTDREIGRNGGDEASSAAHLPGHLGRSNGSGDAQMSFSNAVMKGKKRSKNYARADDHAGAHTSPQPEAEAEGNKALPTAESFITNALPIEVGSLRPAANGMAEGSALAGSRSLEGREPPEPSGKVEVPTMKHTDIRSGAVEPSPALLRSKLVAKATGLMGALQMMPKEDDDAGQT